MGFAKLYRRAAITQGLQSENNCVIKNGIKKK